MSTAITVNGEVYDSAEDWNALRHFDAEKREELRTVR